jgi:hypothetical protein
MAEILSFTREPLAFDPETIALAISAYDKAIAALGSSPEVVREVVAKFVIQYLAEGERDPVILCERALAAAGIPDPALSQR